MEDDVSAGSSKEEGHAPLRPPSGEVCASIKTFFINAVREGIKWFPGKRKRVGDRGGEVGTGAEMCILSKLF